MSMACVFNERVYENVMKDQETGIFHSRQPASDQSIYQSHSCKNLLLMEQSPVYNSVLITAIYCLY